MKKFKIKSFIFQLTTLLIFLHNFCLSLQQQQQSQKFCPIWVNTRIQQCVQPVADYAKAVNNQQNEKENSENYLDLNKKNNKNYEEIQGIQWPTKVIGGKIFQELCLLIRHFERCVSGYRTKCRRHITISLIEASYGYLCNEGYEIFVGSAECLMELDQQPNVKGCHDKTLLEIEEANNEQNGTVVNRLERMCNALNYFSECVRPPIRQSCGNEAWNVIFRVLKDTSRILMPMCNFDNYYRSGEEEEEEENNNDYNNNILITSTIKKELIKNYLINSEENKQNQQWKVIEEKEGEEEKEEEVKENDENKIKNGEEDWQQWKRKMIENDENEEEKEGEEQEEEEVKTEENKEEGEEEEEENNFGFDFFSHKIHYNNEEERQSRLTSSGNIKLNNANIVLLLFCFVINLII
ncbi:unnamed protein product [Meloidogyne enterolobii]|uniref:Uncharacterized protein n=1 Tax=Meloidogyne enterolobii TaxID=390850 RepID=A0ACB0ZGP4_MELEN